MFNDNPYMINGYVIEVYILAAIRNAVVGLLQETGQSLDRLSRHEMRPGNSDRIVSPSDQYSRCCTEFKEAEK